jgi:hypothetical protein
MKNEKFKICDAIIIPMLTPAYALETWVLTKSD